MRSTPILVVALAVACSTAAAQTTVTTSTPAQTVEQLAPQLVAFSGSTANFQNLVAGLAAGTPVQLVTPLQNGLTQIVSFTPVAPLQATEIAQLLEASRQQLIGLGIAQPTAEQLGVTLMGGVVPTTLGGSPVAGTLNSPGAQNPPSPAAQLQQRQLEQRQSAASGASAPSVNVQLVPTLSGPAIPSTLPPANTSGSPIPPSTISQGTVGTSASPLPVTPNPLPGAGSTARTAPERVPPGTPKASHR
jgi:hypothetical protein